MKRIHRVATQVGPYAPTSRRHFLTTCSAATVMAWLSPHDLLGEARADTTRFDFFISPDGRDSNAGTLSSPWSITALNTRRSVYAGKRVGLLDGIYNLRTLLGEPLPDNFASNLLTIAGGSPSSPTLVGAVNRHRAVVSGDRDNLTHAYSSALVGPGGAYVTLDGLKLTQANYRAINNYAGGGSNFRVQNCWISDQVYTTGTNQGANSACIFMQGHRDCVVSNCLLESSGSPSDNFRHACIQFYGSEDPVVEYCTIIGSATGANGIHFKETGNKRCTVRYCYIDMSGGTRARTPVLWHGNTNTDGYETMHHCIVIGNSALASEGWANRLRAFNNTAISSSGRMVGWDCRKGGIVDLYNNIVVRTVAGEYRDVAVNSASALATVDYNCYSGLTPEPEYWIGGTSFRGLQSIYSATGRERIGRSLSLADPLFTLEGDGPNRYKLSSVSPCRNAGRVGGTAEGQPVDMGAWAGATQVGCDFDTPAEEPLPKSPLFTVS